MDRGDLCSQRPEAGRREVKRRWPSCGSSGYLALFALGMMASTVTSVGASGGEPSRSTNIALSPDGAILVSVNREADSVSLFNVTGGDGQEALQQVTEIKVGQEPHCVTVRPNGSEAYVTNAASGTVSAIALGSDPRVVATIPVETEPRGCALTPSGDWLYVANHTAGTISVIDVSEYKVIDTIHLGGNPTAIAITDNGDGNDHDERVFVTRFFAECLEDRAAEGTCEGFDDGKQGIVQAFYVGGHDDVERITLSPLTDVGFTADRSQFCTRLNPNAANDLFCPDPEAAEANEAILNDPQGAFPNQLQAALIRGRYLYLPNVGAGPEPPLLFNVNVQALVHVVDTEGLKEDKDRHVNLNAQIKLEPEPEQEPGTLQRAFGNDIVAIDATPDGKEFLIVSRGGNYVLRAKLGDDGRLDIGAPDNVVRLQTGNIPTGIVIDAKGKRAYVNNEVGLSVSVLNLESNTVLARDISSSTLPAPGSFAHGVLLGRLTFFTALGVSDNGLIGTEIRDIDPVQFRGKASKDAWSGCGSCHDSGLADGVSWFFPTGIRQTVPLDGFFSKDNPADQRISNWSAIRGSITDFNNNSRNVQGGIGFASDPPFSAEAPNPNIFNHGITQGASQALDFETLWVQTVRALNMPVRDAEVVNAGRGVFETACASCHGGVKWTKSQVLYKDNPAFDANPLAGGQPIDPGVESPAAGQIRSYTVGDATLEFLKDVGTFDPANPVEIRGQGNFGAVGLGELGFNVPALLGVGYHAPYFHNGAAQNFDDVFALHVLDGGTIEQVLGEGDRANLKAFLATIDGRTAPLRSEGDEFRDLAGLP
ncbi:MAG: beta-propeller fold lactonase family protein [Gammaproteobacteria bacterium]